MKDIVSLLLTTSCLAIAGIGIYFFSYNSHENDDVTQKAGKKPKFNSTKKQIDIEDSYDDDNFEINNDDENSLDNEDNISNNDYKYKSKPNSKSKSKNNKTKKNTNKVSYSKKNYYY